MTPGNSYLTTTSLSRRLSIPFNLSQARLEPDTAQPVAYFNLALGQRMRLAWFQVHFIRVVAAAAPPTKVNSALAAVYAGLYGSGANYITEPSGQRLTNGPCEIPGVNSTDPNFYEDFSTPDVYSVMVVNNFSDAAVDVTITGAFSVELT